MTGGFGGFVNEKKDKEVKLYVRNREVDKLIKEYKKLKKYQKSSIFEIEKLSGKETKIDKLINEYGIDSEAIE
jgi:DNA mismatch repair ATPase MutS